MIYVVVSDDSDQIVNRVRWDGDEQWDAPPGSRLVCANDNPEWGIGGYLTTDLQYTPPAPLDS